MNLMAANLIESWEVQEDIIGHFPTYKNAFSIAQSVVLTLITHDQTN